LSILQTHFRPFRESFTKQILDLYELSIEEQHKKYLYTSHPTTLLYSLQFGNNTTTNRIVTKHEERTKPSLYLAIFLEDCYDEDTTSFVLDLLEDLYQFLHHEDTKAHGITNVTDVINYSFFDQVSKLKVHFINSLKCHYKSMYDKYLSSYNQEDLFQSKYEILISQFSFYCILIFIKAVGLFPIVEEYNWIYSENQEMKSKMQCTSLAFLYHTLDSCFKKKVVDDKFIETFSKRLGFFVKDRYFPESIMSLSNDQDFVAEIKEWFNDFVSTQYYKDYFTQDSAVDTVVEATLFSTTRRQKRPPTDTLTDDSKRSKHSDYELITAPSFTSTVKSKLLLQNRGGVEPSRECCSNIGSAIECPLDCEGGEICCNKRVRKLRQLVCTDHFALPGLFEVRSNEKGKGLYALKVWDVGEELAEYVGEGVDLLTERKPIYEYLMHLQNNFYLDAKRKGNLSRFINHSCNPNCEVQKIIVSRPTPTPFFYFYCYFLNPNF